jgi:hypothetical protein
MDSNHRLYGFASRRIKPLCHQRLDITRRDSNPRNSNATCTVAFWLRAHLQQTLFYVWQANCQANFRKELGGAMLPPILLAIQLIRQRVHQPYQCCSMHCIGSCMYPTR